MALVSAALYMIVPLAAAESPTQLLSLTGIKLKAFDGPGGEFVSAFEVNTWDVQVLAVCHIPPGWTVTAGRNADFDGILSGVASLGVAYINASQLSELDAIFLVRVGKYREHDDGDCTKHCIPATFSGDVTVGTYGLDADSKLRLRPSNIHLQDASKCPTNF